MLKLRNAKGTKDYLPEEQRIRREIVRNLESTFEKYGYQPLETPILNNFEVLASKYAGGAEILKEVYNFKNQGDKELGLRYDLTVPFAKVIGMNSNVRIPFKRYEIGKVFRDGPVKLGRYREFTQCDVDLVGVDSMIAEAELMSMAVKAFKEMDLDVYISYNNRKLLTGVLEVLGVEQESVKDVILTLDKLLKITREEMEEELFEKKVSRITIEKIFMFLDMNKENFLSFVEENVNRSKTLAEGFKEFSELECYLKELGIDENVRFNSVLARGLDIYTGTVFEVFLKNGSFSSSLAAGGRFNEIIGGFLNNGKIYPAVGISFGLDTIFTAFEVGKKVREIIPYDLFIIPINTNLKALKLANELREEGLRVDCEMVNRRFKKSLDYANKNKIPYVIVFGESEIETQKVRLKNMFESTEEEISISEISTKILKNKNGESK